MGPRKSPIQWQESEGDWFVAREVLETSLHGDHRRSILRVGEGELRESWSHDCRKEHDLLSGVGLLHAAELQWFGFQLKCFMCERKYTQKVERKTLLLLIEKIKFIFKTEWKSIRRDLFGCLINRNIRSGEILMNPYVSLRVHKNFATLDIKNWKFLPKWFIKNATKMSDSPPPSIHKNS